MPASPIHSYRNELSYPPLLDKLDQCIPLSQAVLLVCPVFPAPLNILDQSHLLLQMLLNSSLLQKHHWPAPPAPADRIDQSFACQKKGWPVQVTPTFHSCKHSGLVPPAYPGSQLNPVHSKILCHIPLTHTDNYDLPTCSLSLFLQTHLVNPTCFNKQSWPMISLLTNDLIESYPLPGCPIPPASAENVTSLHTSPHLTNPAWSWSYLDQSCHFWGSSWSILATP